MATAAIDTLRYAERVKESGVEHSTANEMARALNDELADHVPTKVDLEPRFESLETKVESLDTKFEARCDALEAKFDARCDAMEAKFEARINALDAKLEAKFDSLAASLKTTNAMMLFGFALLGTLGFFPVGERPLAPASAGRHRTAGRPQRAAHGIDAMNIRIVVEHPTLVAMRC